jgi:hypothetical protein
MLDSRWPLGQGLAWCGPRDGSIARQNPGPGSRGSRQTASLSVVDILLRRRPRSRQQQQQQEHADAPALAEAMSLAETREVPLTEAAELLADDRLSCIYSVQALGQRSTGALYA